jgi:hypothetical protein
MKGPPCKECAPHPGVVEGNETAVALIQRVMTTEGVRLEALEAAMRIYRIPIDERALESDKVLFISGLFLKHRSEYKEESKNHAEGGDRIRKHPSKA